MIRQRKLIKPQHQEKINQQALEARHQLTAAQNDAWQLGTGGRDWCIEAWIYPFSTSGNQTIFAHGTASNVNRWYYIF